MVGLHSVIVTVKHFSHLLKGLWVGWDEGEELHEPATGGGGRGGEGGGEGREEGRGGRRGGEGREERRGGAGEGRGGEKGRGGGGERKVCSDEVNHTKEEVSPRS